MKDEIEARMNKSISQDNVNGSTRIQKHVYGMPDFSHELSWGGNIKLGGHL